MELKALNKVEQLALRRLYVFQQSSFIYLLRAMLASMFIGFGVIVAFKTGNFFYLEQSPFTYPMAAVTFGAAIILISYGGGDLFTGDTFYYTYAGLRKKMRWSDVGKLWTYSYVGNIIGALAFAALIYATGLFDDVTVNGFLLDVAKSKTELPTSELFFRAILCNWLVCLAFFVPMSIKGDGAKLFTLSLIHI